LALAGLLHPFVDGSGGERLCRRWKLSNSETNRVQWLLTHQKGLAGASQVAWSSLQPVVVSEGIEELLALVEAIAAAAGRSSDDAAYCRELLKQPCEQLDPPPLLSGNDLIAHGVPRGKRYARLLQQVRDAQLDGKVGTKAEALQLVDRLMSSDGPAGGDSTPSS
jgi:poly(A) polymerase